MDWWKYITWKANKTTRIYLYDGEMPYRGVYLGDYYFKGKQNNYTVFNTSGHIYINKDVERKSSSRMFTRLKPLCSQKMIEGNIFDFKSECKWFDVRSREAAKSE